MKLHLEASPSELTTESVESLSERITARIGTEAPDPINADRVAWANAR